MNNYFHDLHTELVKGIEEIEKKNPDPRKQIENCFHFCENIRQQVERALPGAAFQNEASEIEFFRRVKPRFTSLVEFYSILYRVELFIPENDADKAEFWGYELQRAESFLTRHEDLLNYLKSGDVSRDREYFLREDPGSASAKYDELIAKLLARENYIGYIKTKILPGLQP